ncbi:MAG: hypothetical protein KDI23_09630, partial [Pseudomonadales bacterium]|nr:hypothetical protein [Pseudomonadales bacterium]
GRSPHAHCGHALALAMASRSLLALSGLTQPGSKGTPSQAPWVWFSRYWWSDLPAMMPACCGHQQPRAAPAQCPHASVMSTLEGLVRRPLHQSSSQDD